MRPGGSGGWLLQNMVTTTQDDPFRDALARLERQTDTRSEALRWFWAHLVSVEATVLGLIVGLSGLTGSSERAAFLLLAVSWVGLSVAILTGTVLLRIDADRQVHRALLEFRLAYDLREIQSKLNQGGSFAASEDLQGLVLAALIYSDVPPGRPSAIWTEPALALAKQYVSRLPSARIGIKVVELHRTVTRLTTALHWFERILYVSSGVAFASLIMTGIIRFATG